jgi:hypothetical protein
MAAVPNHEKSPWQHFQLFPEIVANFGNIFSFFWKMLTSEKIH